MDDWHSTLARGETLRAKRGSLRGAFRTRLRARLRVASAWEGGRVERGDAADHTVGPRYFNLEPDGFAVFGGLNLSVEYVDPAIRTLLPELDGDIARSSNESCRRVSEVAVQVLETGVAALVKGLPAVTGGTVDLMLKRIDADNGRRVLALARIVPAEPGEEEAEWGVTEPAQPTSATPPQVGERYRFERIGPLPMAEPPPTPLEASPRPTAEVPRAAPAEPTPTTAGATAATAETRPQQPAAGEPTRAPVSREAVLAAEPITRTPAGEEAGSSFATTLEHVGVGLQVAHDTERGLEHALRDAAVALGCSTASLMLRRNRTSVVEVTYGMPADYRGLRFRDDQTPHDRMARTAGDVIAIEDAATDDRVDGERLRLGQILAVLAVPLLSNDERIGVVYFNWDSPQRFSVEQRAFVRSLSSILSPQAQVLRLMRWRTVRPPTSRRCWTPFELRADRGCEAPSLPPCSRFCTTAWVWTTATFGWARTTTAFALSRRSTATTRFPPTERPRHSDNRPSSSTA